MPERVDWQIPVKPRPRMRTVDGKLAHGFSLTAEPAAGAVVYLIVGGRVVGPRRWGNPPSRP